MTTVKILFDICGRCGDEIVGDNTGTGRAWQHVNGREDHLVVFGQPAGWHIAKTNGLAGLSALEEILEADVATTLPDPGTPRPAEDYELGTNRSGSRQMIRTATTAGFEITAQVCTGPVKIGTNHDPRGYRLVDSLLVGFRHTDGRVAIGVWERQSEKPGDTFGFDFGLSPAGSGLMSAAELKAYLKG